MNNKSLDDKMIKQTNNFVKELKSLILRNLDSGDLDIIDILKTIRHKIVYWLNCLDQFTENIFECKLIIKGMKWLAWSTWAYFCSLITWCLLFKITSN